MTEIKKPVTRYKKPIRVTIVAACEHQGKQCVLRGRRMIEDNGFRPAQVYRCAQEGLKEHRGCVFEYITEKEAQNLEDGFPQVLIDYLRNIAYVLNPVILGVNTETGAEIEMTTAGDMQARGFVPAKVRAIVDKDKLYKKWKFTRKTK